MTPSAPAPGPAHTPGDAELARLLAAGAGELLLSVRAGPGWGAGLGRRGDQAANRYLVDALRSERPGDAILSEEEADDSARLEAARVWIIDPLDGTREFAEPGRIDWAVHVALWAGGRIAAAAVALPAEGLTLSTVDAPLPPPVRAGRRRLVVSRSRPPARAAGVAAALDADMVALGSAGAKAMAVVRGDADAYLHTGGQSEWDSAAPVGVARAAGLHASRVNGAPLVYNQPDPSLPDLLICRPELAGTILAAIDAA